MKLDYYEEKRYWRTNIWSFARDIDIKTLETAVKKENLPSIKMTGKFMSYIRDEGDTAIFKINF